jgi:hypothetical protein
VKCCGGQIAHGVSPFACFRAQRLGGLSYFAGAEKKDDRVLVPDLGSLTSIHDRWVDHQEKKSSSIPP